MPSTLAIESSVQLQTKQATVSKPKRYETLDMWRGLCCLMLVVFHTTMQVARHYFVDQSGKVTDVGSLGMWLAARAWIGVPIFFVISGYCIMATLHARQRKGVIEFAKRRFWRIYPPYWTAIAISAVVILALNSRWPGLVHDGIFTVPNPDAMTRWEWLGNLTLTESWRHCVFGGHAQHMLPNTWTLVLRGTVLRYRGVYFAVCLAPDFHRCGGSDAIRGGGKNDWLEARLGRERLIA